MRAIIRPAQVADLAHLYRIVLQVADNGRDATKLHHLQEIQGEVYVGPYVVFEPDLAFVLEDEEGPAGFVLGAFDSRLFEARLEREWWPVLRQRYSAARDKSVQLRPKDEQMLAHIRNPPVVPAAIYSAYPSHLHVDILPRQQGKGQGRRLIETLFDALNAKGSQGVHLFVSLENHTASGFYRHVGMTEFSRQQSAIVMVRRFR